MIIFYVVQKAIRIYYTYLNSRSKKNFIQFKIFG